MNIRYILNYNCLLTIHLELIVEEPQKNIKQKEEEFVMWRQFLTR